jgi:hypothetical protein
VLLDFPVLARSRGSAPDSFHQPLMDFPDQPFSDRPTVFEILGDELERLTYAVHAFIISLKVAPRCLAESR